ncbi:MAG: hypothetical protein ACXVBU_08175 [Ktedonobacteraceae bacterium]
MNYATRFNSRPGKIMLLLSKFRPKAQRTQAPRKGDGVWEELQQSLRDQFPNLQRHGCPGPKILESIARGQMPLSQAERWLDHLGHCSPCFHDFDAIRVRRSRYRRLTWGTAAAAIIIILCSAPMLRVLHNKYSSVRAGLHPADSAPTSPQTSIAQPLLATLNLEDSSITRGPASDSGLQRLARAQLLISIYLPPGSAPGNYEFQFLVNPTDSQPLVSVRGTANIVNGRTVLRLATDLSHFEPGEYVIAFRRVGAGWVYSSVEIS